MEEIDEIREIYENSTTPWSEHVRVLLSALDERDAELNVLKEKFDNLSTLAFTERKWNLGDKARIKELEEWNENLITQFDGSVVTIIRLEGEKDSETRWAAHYHRRVVNLECVLREAKKLIQGRFEPSRILSVIDKALAPDECKHKYERNASWYDIRTCVHCDKVHPDDKHIVPDKGEKIDCFIGDKIKDRIREGGQVPVVDKVTLANAKEEADIYLSESNPTCGTCNDTGVVPDYETKDPISECVIGGMVKLCPDCTKGGGG